MARLSFALMAAITLALAIVSLGPQRDLFAPETVVVQSGLQGEGR